MAVCMSDLSCTARGGYTVDQIGNHVKTHMYIVRFNKTIIALIQELKEGICGQESIV